MQAKLSSYNYIKTYIMRSLPFSISNRLYLVRNKWRPAAWADADFYFIHIPKSAGKSIAQAVGKPTSHVLISLTPPDIQKTLCQKPCLAVVRDPTTRVISTFNYAHSLRSRGIISSIDFAAFFIDVNEFVHSRQFAQCVRDHYFFWPASKFIADARSCGANVFIADYGSINSALDTFFFINDIPRPNLGWINRPSVRVADKEMLSDASRSRIESLYLDDYAILDNL